MSAGNGFWEYCICIFTCSCTICINILDLQYLSITRIISLHGSGRGCQRGLGWNLVTKVFVEKSCGPRHIASRIIGKKFTSKCEPWTILIFQKSYWLIMILIPLRCQILIQFCIWDACHQWRVSCVQYFQNTVFCSLKVVIFFINFLLRRKVTILCTIRALNNAKGSSCFHH